VTGYEAAKSVTNGEGLESGLGSWSEHVSSSNVQCSKFGFQGTRSQIVEFTAITVVSRNLRYRGIILPISKLLLVAFSLSKRKQNEGQEWQVLIHISMFKKLSPLQ
jgi:hypothetical protein